MIKNGRWLGTYSVWQNRQFAELFAKFRGYKLLSLDGVLIYISSKPMLGNVTAYVYEAGEEKLLSADFIQKLKEYLKRYRIPRAFIYSSFDVAYPLSELESGGTYLIDLSKSENELFASLQARCRNAVRKGEKTGLSFYEVSNRKDFDKWWEVYGNTVKQKRFGKQNKNLIFGLFNSKIGRLFVVSIENRITAGAFLLIDKCPVYYLGAMDREFSKLSPNNFLHWQVMLLLKSEGYGYYDLGGVSPQGRAHGPSYFKESFGGEFIKSRNYIVHNCVFIKSMLLSVYDGLLWIKKKIYAFRGRGK